MINRIFRTQLWVTLALSAFAMFFGYAVGLSVLAGGVVSLITSYYFARKVFLTKTGRAPEVAGQIYLAEFIKVALAAVLLTTIWAMVEGIIAIALILGFVIVHSSVAFLNLDSGWVGSNQGRLRD